MKKEKHILISNIHRYFGVEFNNTTHKYFDKKNRTPEETEDMIGYAHSALHHWKLYSGGTIANVLRGEYMVAKAYALAGKKEESLVHAKKCEKLVKDHPSEMKDFDFAFANEVMAIASKINKDKAGFKKYKVLAEKSGNEITGKGDRKVFFKEFEKYLDN